jgi:N-acylneuraminate cytidylyltransferase
MTSGSRVAIIPARGGSKRIPRKNIREFCGKPMIAWSIEAALRSGCFDRVIVSTDDDEIAAVSEKFGAETPFRRPAELSDDYTATRPVINHSIEQIEILYGRPDYICCIYATAPLLDSATIKAAYFELVEKKLDFVFSAGAFSYPIQRAFRNTSKGHPERLHPETRYTRSQDLEECYHDAGQFYWGKSAAFLDNCDTISIRSFAHILPLQNVQDIDTEDDWRRAEILMKSNSELKNGKFSS